ncbi:hypothetical protein [Streptomyces sp. NRRL F-5135]|uniref:hypothetical protein n=1 Tax=Streptomyces sp. NRRL F-5135 TaxID=1463858 RepID=UPI0004CAB36A|nr:hypothetical protein [Streptomyces sp. NRRL F-5135]
MTSANGKRQPVNADPDPAGNVAVSRGPDGLLYVRSLTRAHPEPRAGEYRMMPHHATCPPPPQRGTGGGRPRTGIRRTPPSWRRP